MGNKAYVFAALAAAYRCLRKAPVGTRAREIRAILERNPGMALPHVLGPLLDVLSYHGRVPAEGLEYAQALVEKWLAQGSVEVRLISCQAQVLRLEGRSFADAKRRVEDQCAGVSPPLRLDAHCVHHLLHCRRANEDEEPRAELVRTLLVDGKRPPDRYVEEFWQCLREAGDDEEAQKLEQQVENARAKACKGRGKNSRKKRGSGSGRGRGQRWGGGRGSGSSKGYGRGKR
mmetsp:Transcript_17945/g.69509  ORF Transcript_17945/g.69509 Transcript_17945/m.69509 type:complete len:231 (+) Transcript_17945:829-1521(+)